MEFLVLQSAGREKRRLYDIYSSIFTIQQVGLREIMITTYRIVSSSITERLILSRALDSFGPQRCLMLHVCIATRLRGQERSDASEFTVSYFSNIIEGKDKKKLDRVPCSYHARIAVSRYHCVSMPRMC